jgi:molybdopterin synthase catalytic subunit
VNPNDVVRIQEADFDPDAELESFRDGANGAIVSFIGVARDLNEQFPVEELTLEHYPGMTERSLGEIVERARARWAIGRTCVVHRVGRLMPRDRIVLVAVSSAHRGEAFEACRFIVDFLKTDAPFWKRESGASGTRWVEAREGDEQARKGWEKSVPGGT